jgi:hypothetical protein
MNFLITFAFYIASVIFWYLLFDKIHKIAELESRRKSGLSQKVQASQSQISGLFICALSLLAGLFYRPLIFACIPGIIIILSGSRFISRKSRSVLITSHVRGIYIGLTGLLICLGAFGLQQTFTASNTKMSIQKPEAASQVLNYVQEVSRQGFARSGPSVGHSILGICLPGTTVKILSKESGFYFVQGKYLLGKKGKGREREGQFWVRGKLFK